jgi:hypothetical protein
MTTGGKSELLSSLQHFFDSPAQFSMLLGAIDDGQKQPFITYIRGTAVMPWQG